MGLEEDYPKTSRGLMARWRQLLAVVPDLDLKARETLALALNELADHARDLDDIMNRLLDEPHTPAEVGDLLIAVELTLEQIRGYSDDVDGKLYEIGDRLNGRVETESDAAQ
jgi:hypothetical protein